MSITKNAELQDRIDQAPMSAFQVWAVAICLLINFLDGFDILAIAFAAPEIAADWNVSPTALGIIFSAGLAGMVVGALLLSPLADRIGRRPLVLTCLLIIAAGMFGSALTTSVEQLVGMRIVTGLGVGAMLPSLTTMVAEYSNARYRQFAISVLQSGYPVGAIIAGFSAAWLLASFDWRSIFVVGGALSLAMVPVVLWRLPESVGFLLTCRPPGALQRLNELLPRLNQPQLDALPEQAPDATTVRSRWTVFNSIFVGRTIAIWLAYLALMSAFYFVTSWTPKVLVDAGLTREAGISGGVLIATGGVVGGLLLGVLTRWVPLVRIGTAYMLLGMLSMILFGRLELVLGTLLVVAFFEGFFLAGSIICLYALIPSLYPTEIRNTGAGWALGIGRLGAVIGPYIAGVLIAADWSRADYYLALSLPVMLSIAAVLWLRRVVS